MSATSPEAQLHPPEIAALRNYKLDHAYDEMFAGA